jgi:hypothetical protein
MVNKMINCLTISQYRDFSEDGQKALDLIACLENESNIQNKNEYVSCSENKKAIELSDSNRFDIDVCLQHMLNDKFVRTEYNDVGVFEPRTKNSLRYDNFLNLLDTIIVRSSTQKQILPEHLKKKTKIVRPVSSSPSKVDPTKKLISKFVFSCQFDNKIDDVLISYFNSFTINDNVCLAVLSDAQTLIQKINQVRDALALYNAIDLYPEVQIVDSLDMLLNISHCAIEVSGTYDVKNFCLSSIKYGNPIITLKNNPVLEWLNENCYYVSESHQDFAKSYETCEFLHRFSLSENMRKIFHCRKEFLEKQKALTEEYHKSFEYNQDDSIGAVLCSL